MFAPTHTVYGDNDAMPNLHTWIGVRYWKMDEVFPVSLVHPREKRLTETMALINKQAFCIFELSVCGIGGGAALYFWFHSVSSLLVLSVLSREVERSGRGRGSKSVSV